MSEQYIKRSDAEQAKCEFMNPNHEYAIGWNTCNAKYRENILAIPAADVRPVVRGRWVNGKCDNCGEHAPYWCLATTFHESNYCPNCGADMREVNPDDQR